MAHWHMHSAGMPCTKKIFYSGYSLERPQIYGCCLILIHQEKKPGINSSFFARPPNFTLPHYSSLLINFVAFLIPFSSYWRMYTPWARDEQLKLVCIVPGGTFA